MRMTRAGTGGPPLVFVHGFACDGTDWQAQVDSLETRTTVVVCRTARASIEPGRTGQMHHRGIRRCGSVEGPDETGTAAGDPCGPQHGVPCGPGGKPVQPDAVSGLVLVDGSRISEGDPMAAARAMADELAGDGYPRFVRQKHTAGQCSGEGQGRSPARSSYRELMVDRDRNPAGPRAAVRCDTAIGYRRSCRSATSIARGVTASAWRSIRTSPNMFRNVWRDFGALKNSFRTDRG